MSKPAREFNEYLYLHYTLRLRAPLVLTQWVSGDPNSAASMWYIPGSAVRGAVAARLMQERGEDDVFRSIIFSGRVGFLNAYPKVLGIRTRPTPLSYFVKEKESGDSIVSVYDLASHSDLIDAGFTPETDSEEFVPLPAPFVSSEEGPFGRGLMVHPRVGARLHNQRDREKGRAWKRTVGHAEERHGEIFFYEYLEKDQEFQGVFLIRGSSKEECEQLASYLRECLAGESPLLLGKSRRIGYGGDATIQLDARTRDFESLGVKPLLRDIPAEDYFRAVLTADYIGRDAHTGQPDPSYIVHELVESLGNRAEVVSKFWAFGRIGGYNRRWRLPRPQLPTCLAGSVFVLRAMDSISADVLTHIQHEGLGLRRIDGFGRLIFLAGESDRDIRLGFWTRDDESRERDNVGESPETFGPGTEVYELERRLLEEAVRKEIAGTVQEWVAAAANIPSTSLLGRLRTPLRQSPQAALRTLGAWLSDGEDSSLKEVARRQLERCGVEGRPLLEWLRSIVTGEAPLNSFIDPDVIAQNNHLTSEENACRHFEDPDFALRIRVQFLDALLEEMMRRNRQAAKRVEEAGNA